MRPDIVKNVTEAKAKMIEGGQVIWNTRLTALADAGDLKGFLDALKAPVDDQINNCGCNVQCGAMERGFGAIASPQSGG